METPAIQIDNLSFRYDEPLVLEDVNLCLHRGEFACIVGPNGGGKTTLLKLLLGLLEPTRGTIQIFGASVASARGQIGYMPQHAALDRQFPVSVLDVVLLGRLTGRLAIGPYRKADRAAAHAALDSVGLTSLAQRPFSDLSGGQRQRVLIARALVCNPRLLLLDEPTANLDRIVQDDFYALVRELKRDISIVMVSHDLGFVSKEVERVICVNREVHEHPTRELTGDALAHIYGTEMRMIRHDQEQPHRHEQEPA